MIGGTNNGKKEEWGMEKGKHPRKWTQAEIERVRRLGAARINWAEREWESGEGEPE